jgi:hypothetical protein
MCVVITIIMLGLAISNLMAQNWLTGAVQIAIALGFLLLLINNIRRTKAERAGQCYNGCQVTNWLGDLFKKKEK